MTGCSEHDDDDDEPSDVYSIYGLFNDTLSFSDYTASEPTKPFLVISRSEV